MADGRHVERWIRMDGWGVDGSTEVGVDGSAGGGVDGSAGGGG